MKRARANNPELTQALALLARQFEFGALQAETDPVGFLHTVTREIMGLRAVVCSAAVELEGCGDNSCVVQAPKGMATNGGCRCNERQLRRAVQALKAKLRMQPEEP